MGRVPKQRVLSELGQSVVELRTVLHMHLMGLAMELLFGSPLSVRHAAQGHRIHFGTGSWPAPLGVGGAHLAAERRDGASKIAAMLAARRAIDRWCRDNPTLCAPRVADPIVLRVLPI